MMATQPRRWMFRRKNSNTAQRPRTLLTGPGTRENTLWRFWRFVWRNRYAIPAGALKNCASSALDLREPFGSPAIQWAFTMSATPGAVPAFGQRSNHDHPTERGGGRHLHAERHGFRARPQAD